MESIKIAFLNVGHGDSSVIIYPDKKSAAVIDTPEAHITYDYLLKNNIDYLRWVMISHSHVDHTNGIIDLIKQFHAGERIIEIIYYNRDTIERAANDQKNKQKYLILLKQILHLIDKGIIKNPGLPATLNSTFTPIDGVTVKIIHPSHDDLTREIVQSNNVNDASVVVRLCYGHYSVLFTGDLSEKGWNWLKSRNQCITANILKFPHHGSWFEGIPDLIKAINPQYIILSYGANSENQYGLPSKETLNYLNMKNFKQFSTKFSHQEFIITPDSMQICSAP